MESGNEAKAVVTRIADQVPAAAMDTSTRASNATHFAAPLAVLAAAAMVASDHQAPKQPETYADRLDKISKSDVSPALVSTLGSKTKVIGRWTEEEQGAFIQGLKSYGRNWKRVQGLVKTRTLTQIRTHAQKFFRKVSCSLALSLCSQNS